MPQYFQGLGALAKAFEAAAIRHEVELEAVAAESAAILYEKVIGIMGDPNKLQPLAPSTQAQREREGFTPNNPLVKSGELLRSQEVAAEGHVAGVGTADPRMVWLEWGTGHIPPRPTYKIALAEAADEVLEVVENSAANILGTGYGRGKRLSL